MAITQLFFWGVVFMRLFFWKKASASPKVSEGISVVICARNEAQNLRNNLPAILEQDYPCYEVLVVNDASTDTTAVVIHQLQKQYPQLCLVTIKDKKHLGKKAALAKGIAAAQYKWLLLTDADCCPRSKHWISDMQAAATPETEMVLGYGPYNYQPTWVNRWVQFETTYTALQYFSFSLWGMPYMGVGRNLLYKKSLYEKHNGFEGHASVIAGDDDLFVNAAATGQNTRITLAPTTFMYSDAPESWQALYRQKQRHYSVSNRYRWEHQLLLGLLTLSQVSYYVILFFFIATNIWKFGILVLFIIRAIVVNFVFIRTAKLLAQHQSWKYFGLMEMLLPFYYALFALSVLFPKQQKWN